jgi:hypothetical protein
VHPCTFSFFHQCACTQLFLLRSRNSFQWLRELLSRQKKQRAALRLSSSLETCARQNISFLVQSQWTLSGLSGDEEVWGQPCCRLAVVILWKLTIFGSERPHQKWCVALYADSDWCLPGRVENLIGRHRVPGEQPNSCLRRGFGNHEVLPFLIPCRLMFH